MCDTLFAIIMDV